MTISLIGSCASRFSSSAMRRSSGSTPLSGEILPPSTWYLPRKVPDFSRLRMSTGRSTTQTSEASRRGSAQMAQGDCSVSAPQIVAEPDPLAGVEDGLGQLLDGAGLGLDQVQGDALGRARADAGQLAQGGDQRGDRFGKGGHGAWNRERRQPRSGTVETKRHGSVKPGQVEAGGDLAHFGGGDFLGLAQGLVGRRQDHVLEQLRVGRVERLRDRS